MTLSDEVPAGWYPMPDGRQRYWDGTRWTNLPPTDGQPLSTEMPAARNPRFRKRLVVILAATALVIGAGSAAAFAVKSNSDAQVAAKEMAAAEAVEADAEADEAAAVKAQNAADAAERSERSAAIEEIEASVQKMAEEHVTEEIIDGPVISTSCSPVGGGSLDDLTEQTTIFDCFVATEDNGDGTMSGHSYGATMNWTSGQFTYGFGSA